MPEDSCIEIRCDVPARSVLEVRQRNLYPGRKLVVEDALREYGEIPGVICIAAIGTEGRPVGCATLLEEPWEGRLLRIRWLGVDAQYRGLGVGSSLVQCILDIASDRGERIWCNVRVRARPVYGRLDFRVTGREFEVPGVGAHVRMVWPT